MKKIITLLLSALFVFSCTVAPTETPKVTTTEEIGANKKIVVKVNTPAASRGAIDIIEAEIVQSVVTITSPDGTTESKVWLKNGSTTLTFNSQGPGSYHISVTETDSSGNESTYGSPFTVKQGVNIILSITPGSNIIVDITPPVQPDPPVTYTFSVEAVNNGEGSGTIAPSSTANGTYELDTPITVEAAADVDNVFSGWYDAATGGNLITKEPVYSFTLKNDSALFARFIRNSHTVTFADPIVEGLVRGAISKPSGGLTYNDVKGITSLVKGDFTNGQVIGSLEGLQYLTSLQTIDIINRNPWGGSPGNITDLTPLTNLTNLKVIRLSNNRITSVAPLANLTALTDINFANNQIADITGLKDLTALNTLHLSGNSITDITPISNLRGLTKLWLFSNSITELSPIVNLTALTELWLTNNGITDVTALINSPGLNNGDNLYIKAGNTIAQGDLDQLTAKGVRVQG